MNNTSELIEITVGKIAHGGHCVARYDGRVVFVRHAIPGEVVRARLTEAAPDSSFWRADAVEILEPSADRVPHFWPAADALRRLQRPPVGGAEFGHISRTGQRRLKAAVVQEQLQRLGGIDPDSYVLDMEVEDVDAHGTPEQAQGFGWRTRTGFAVTSAGHLGMHAHRSDAIIGVQAMPLAVPGINDLGLWNLDLAGLTRIELAAPSNGSQPLVLLAAHADLGAKAAGKLLKRVASALPATVSVAGWNPLTGGLEPIHGRSWVAETVGDTEYRVTGEGFWQIHRRAPEVLTGTVLDYLQPYLQAGSAVADLYAGAGLFSAPLADVVGDAGLVLSIEGSPGASRDAKKNLHAAASVDIQQGKVDKVLGAHLRGAARPLDAVVLDPPRAGAGKVVVQQLTSSGAKAVAYVSCDPASFARDVGYFGANGWELAELRGFDLYPHTHHTETVALLLPKGGGARR
ncbi:MAG: class I SAM-dependent RNA methyltransferase [Acidobacteria bacterium]|nr:class I SAM-dependent RNA methyltransferase [Acidobacteriota bacterium]